MLPIEIGFNVASQLILCVIYFKQIIWTQKAENKYDYYKVAKLK